MVPRKLDIYIGGRICERRVEVGLSVEELAPLIGCSTRELVEFESGERRVSAPLLADFANVLTVEIGYFFDGVATAGPQRLRLHQTNSATVIPFRKGPVAGDSCD